MTEQALHFHAPAKAAPASTGTGRWCVAQIEELFALPFPELIDRLILYAKERAEG